MSKTKPRKRACTTRDDRRARDVLIWNVGVKGTYVRKTHGPIGRSGR